MDDNNMFLIVIYLNCDEFTFEHRNINVLDYGVLPQNLFGMLHNIWYVYCSISFLYYINKNLKINRNNLINNKIYKIIINLNKDKYILFLYCIYFYNIKYTYI